jgi:ABC-type bacteriocin/lantibiotic exporter with double-glycine peptidase domain
MIDFPDVRQLDGHDCGATCVYGVLRVLKLRVRRSEVARALLTDDLDGTHPAAVEAYLRQQGLKVSAGNMSLKDLAHHTKAGRPVILAVKGHYLVAVHATRTHVTVHDPEQGKLKMHANDLEAIWHDTTRSGAVYDHYGIVAYRGA